MHLSLGATSREGDDAMSNSRNRSIVPRILVAAGFCASLASGPAQAAVVNIDDIPPGTTVSAFMFGPHIMPIGRALGATAITAPSPFMTPDGNFSVMGTLAASDIGGTAINYALIVSVKDVTGVVSTLHLRVDQSFIVAGTNWAVTPQLMGTFTDVGGAPHGNEVRAQLAVNGIPFGPFVAQDRMGAMFTVPPVPTTTIFPAVSPFTVMTPIDFEFEGTPVAGM
jgi:hypothetical protein